MTGRSACVRGELFSVTYVFQDGTIVSYPEGDSEIQETRAIGWISDPYGIPCVSGERKTNAQSFLSQRIGLSAAAAAAQSSGGRANIDDRVGCYWRCDDGGDGRHLVVHPPPHGVGGDR